MTNINCGDAVVSDVTFDGVEAGALDHFDDLLFGHFTSPLHSTELLWAVTLRERLVLLREAI